MSDKTERPDAPSEEPPAPAGGGQPAAPAGGGQPAAPAGGGQPAASAGGGQPAAPAGGGQPAAPSSGSVASTSEPAATTTGPAPPAPAPPAPQAPAPPAPPPPTAAAAPVPAVPAVGPPPVPAAEGAPSPPSSFFGRVKRVFNFETGVYPEVAADELATLEAIMVVVLSSLLAGGFWNLTLIFFFTVPFALVMTAVSAVLVSVAARLFNRESPGFAAWFRALGYAQAPLSLGLVPLVGSLVGFVYWIATSIAAIHRVARIPVGQAILTWVLALMLPMLFLLALGLLFGGLAVLGTLGGNL